MCARKRCFPRRLKARSARLEDVLDPELDTAANLDAGEVVNYVRAAQFALDRMQQLPLCNRLLRETHAVLMEGVRGEEKNPGEFRRSQNWIAPPAVASKMRATFRQMSMT